MAPVDLPPPPHKSWLPLHRTPYRLLELYTTPLDPDLDLSSHLASGAHCAGAIALHRDDSRLQTYHARSDARSGAAGIDIYSSAGALLRRVNWDKEEWGAVAGLGWTEDEQLVVVSDKGDVRVWDGLGEDFEVWEIGHVGFDLSTPSRSGTAG